jgi:hypothetical protein
MVRAIPAFMSLDVPVTESEKAMATEFDGSWLQLIKAITIREMN